ncbi:4-hydroxy-3-methylbut-2-enyl diphosphate reductase [Actinoplanes sp. TBRC 11911]|nr:4-hydroxy-3-methylbut-2-enyl diphosphate reductase [Actinoplanes sp. TBRC 11911]NMO51123.1 4-hydroxy-3-methylbut-2-enyl diphosphate reductase [Actinoplanes sp. TBRC 11911]
MTAVIGTPLSIESWAVPGSVRLGMGTRAALPDGDAFLVAGVAGGLGPSVRPGDVVVAPDASAPLLAGALRRLGLTVHIGPIHTSDHIVTGAERRAYNALAVDMETERLRVAAGDRPFAAVRAISDGVGAPLWSPAMLGRGVRALKALRTATPALRQWAEAIGGREVLLAAPRSFCAGVERAIEVVERALHQRGTPVYVRRQIVHNAHVVRRLRELGAIFVDEIEDVPPGSTVVLAAHGVAPAVRTAARERDLDVIDATCPLVTKVHSEVKRYAGRGETVFLIGHGDHEEVVGTLGEAPADIVLVEDVAAAERVTAHDPGRVAYAMQTTLAVDEAEEIASVLRSRFPALHAPRREDICYATTNRQQAVRAIARSADLVLVVGSENSSNSVRLVEVAAREGARAHLVEDAGEIELAWLAGVRTVGITAGASAPPHLVDDVVAGLAGLGPVTARESRVGAENVQFALPKEVS